MKLSKNLSLAEVVYSGTAKRLGLSNMPTEKHLANLKAIAEDIFQPLRDGLGVPIYVSSGYRSAALNKAIRGSSKTSQHMKGKALDLDADVYKGVTNKDIFEFIEKNLEFDKLIWEAGTDQNPDWVHVSYKKEGGNRNLKLRMIRDGKGKPTYKYI